MFTAGRTSPLLKKEPNYKHAAAVSSCSNLRTGLLSLRGLNDARRTSGNLQGPAVTPSEQSWHPPNVNCSNGRRASETNGRSLAAENIQYCTFHGITFPLHEPFGVGYVSKIQVTNVSALEWKKMALPVSKEVIPV